MIDLLKSLVPTAKDLSSFRLPKPIQEGVSFGVFLGALVFLSGFTYLAFAVDPLPDPLRSELMWPSARVRTYLECGIDGLFGGVNYSFSLAELVAFLGFTITWYIVMVVLGAASVLSSVLHNLLRDRIDAKELDLSDKDLERLEGMWNELKKMDDFDSHVKTWKDWIFTAQLGIFFTRSILLLSLFVPSACLLLSNPLIVATVPLYFKAPVSPELARWSHEMGFSSFWLLSISCLIWAWISFRHSHAGAKFRSLILVIAMVNVLLLVGNVGSLRGENRIRFQEIQIMGDRFGENDLLPGARSLVLLDRSSSNLRVYNCETGRVVRVTLSDKDIVIEGNLVPLRGLCHNRPLSINEWVATANPMLHRTAGLAPIRR